LLQHVVGTAIAMYDRTAVATAAVAAAAVAVIAAITATNAAAVVAVAKTVIILMMDVCRRWIWRCRVGRTRR